MRIKEKNSLKNIVNQWDSKQIFGQNSIFLIDYYLEKVLFTFCLTPFPAVFIILNCNKVCY